MKRLSVLVAVLISLALLLMACSDQERVDRAVQMTVEAQKPAEPTKIVPPTATGAQAQATVTMTSVPVEIVKVDETPALKSLSQKVLGFWRTPGTTTTLTLIHFWNNGFAHIDYKLASYTVQGESSIIINFVKSGETEQWEVLGSDKDELTIKDANGVVRILTRYPEIENLDSKLLGYWRDNEYANKNPSNLQLIHFEFLNNGQALLASPAKEEYIPYTILPYQVQNNNTIVFGTLPDSLVGLIVLTGASDLQLNMQHIDMPTGLYTKRTLEKVLGYENLAQRILGVWQDQDNWIYGILESGEFRSSSPDGQHDTGRYELLSDTSILLQNGNSFPVFYEFIEVDEQKMLVVPWGRLDSGDDLMLSRMASTDAPTNIIQADNNESPQIFISAQEYYDVTRSNTNAQIRVFQEEIIGAHVSESGEIFIIRENGEVQVRINVQFAWISIYLDDVDPNTLRRLEPTKKISFSGTISHFGYNPIIGNAPIHLNNVLVTAIE